MDDPSYKSLLGQERAVRDLVAIVAARRPDGWVHAFDFGTLRQDPTENVTEERRRRLDDVVWTVRRHGGRGAAHPLHILIEHQFEVDHGMPLRFLDYGSLLHQRLRGNARWRRGARVDPSLHIVVYNGDGLWDAPLSLAGMLRQAPGDGAPHLDAAYEVVDLRADLIDHLPWSNAIRRLAELERADARTLPNRVREVGSWLAVEDRPGLTRSFGLWLEALNARLGLDLSFEHHAKASAMLAERLEKWEAEFLDRGVTQGLEQGLEQEKALLRR